MDAAAIATLIAASGAALAGIVIGIVKAMKRQDERDAVVCSYDAESVHEQTGLLREIRDGIAAIKHELTSQNDKLATMREAVNKTHTRIDDQVKATTELERSVLRGMRQP